MQASVERFVQFSTTDVYGYPGAAAVGEDNPPARFANWYAETKRAAESQVRRVEQDRAAPGQAFNVSDGLPVIWKQLTDDLADGLGCGPVRGSMPYWAAQGLGFSLEQSYRVRCRTTRLRTAPLLSRQAVHVLAKDQDFSSRKARELLDWGPGSTMPAACRRRSGG